MRKIAIITGATSGIGLEITKIIAKEDIDLLLIARSIDVLERLKKEYNNVEYIAQDLSKDVDIEKIKEIIGQREIKYLINNAGFGDFNNFRDSDMSKNIDMINLNIVALTKLSHFFLNETKNNKDKAYLLNVASVASFMPGPLMATYYATKAYVLSLTKAIAFEERNNKKVIISALCPGPTTTLFIKSSNLEKSGLFNNLKNMKPKDVATIAYNNLLKEKDVIITGILNKLMIFAIRFAPSKLVNYITYNIMKKK